jgi:hypothetical protein
MTPDDYGRLYAEARDETPFSNSDQGCGWMARNCDRCLNDKPAREGRDGEGCPLVLVALMGRTPIQWLAETEGAWIYGDFHCIEFRDENDGPGPEPQPIPDPPGQLTLLPRDTYEGHRMLTPLHQHEEARP